MRETAKRLLSAAVALPVYVYAIVTDSLKNVPLLVVTLIVSLACLYEYYQISDKGEGKRPFMTGGMALGAVVTVAMYMFAFGRVYGYTSLFTGFDARAIFTLVTLALIYIFSVQIFRRPIAGGIYSTAVTLFGVVFFVFLFGHIMFLKALRDGVHYIIIVHAVVMLNDTGAYFGGVYFGKHKAGFKVSPNKSWEGYFSGMLVGLVAMMLASQIYAVFFGKHLFSLLEAAILGAVLCIVGNIGDLAESAVKRDGSIKDSGSLIPGHGGVWDVFDSMILTVPLFYYYLILKGVQ
jgi:phosphatidate cytidylyltransferase